jgi:hypothetical protein
LARGKIRHAPVNSSRERRGNQESSTSDKRAAEVELIEQILNREKGKPSRRTEANKNNSKTEVVN